MELDEWPEITRPSHKVHRRLNADLHISGVLPCQVSMYGKHTSKVVADVLDTLRKHFATRARVEPPITGMRGGEIGPRRLAAD